MIRAAQERAARKRYREIAPVLDEQGRRRFAAMEAKALGRGGVSLMSKITGLARRTIYRGISDLRSKWTPGPGRVRAPGAGRKKKTSTDPALLADLKSLVEPVTRGDPTARLLYMSWSVRKLTEELNKLGHEVSHTTVCKLLKEMDYRLQANRKTLEGSDHIDRDGQFEYINKKAKSFIRSDQPVISVDTKEKELVGNFRNNGREWRPKSTPEEVGTHDFIDPKVNSPPPKGDGKPDLVRRSADSSQIEIIVGFGSRFAF